MYKSKVELYICTISAILTIYFNSVNGFYVKLYKFGIQIQICIKIIFDTIQRIGFVDYSISIDFFDHTNQKYLEEIDKMIAFL